MLRRHTLFVAFLRNNLRFLVALISAKHELLFPRAIALLSLLAFYVYLRSPYQLIPEHVPIFGYADDVSILIFGFWVARRLTPAALYINVSQLPRRGKGSGMVALPADYVQPLREFGQGRSIRAFVEDDRPETRWSLYDLLGYRRAWLLGSIGLGTSISSSAPIVIGGCGRSGTTLLRTIFNRHPKVFCGDESTVFLRRISSPWDIARRYGFDTNRVVGMLRDTRSQVEFIEQFQKECLRLSGKPIWAEKTPDNVLRFDFIRSHFPQAHIVHVIRDGRDVVCSLRRQKWFKVPEQERGDIQAVEAAIDYWQRRVEAGLKFRGDPRYHEVRYEDLVDAPKKTLSTLLESLGLDWDESVVVPASTSVARAVHEGTINSDALGQWRRELSAAEIAVIEHKAGRLLTDLGYSV